MLYLYRLSKYMGLEFATAAFHNSYYFHKSDNVIKNKAEVCHDFEQLIAWQLKEWHPKSWFRAWFNMGLRGNILNCIMSLFYDFCIQTDLKPE